MSTPNFDPDDPRLTAYALGESPDASERRAIENLLAASPEARAAVEETRAFARLLAEDFASENAAYQDARRRAETATNIVPFPQRSRRWRPFVASILKVAAVLFVLGVAVLVASRRKPPAPVAVAPPVAPSMKDATTMPSAEPPPPAESRGTLASTDESVQGGATKPAVPSPDTPADRVAQASVRRIEPAGALPGAGLSAPRAAAPMTPPAPPVDRQLAAAMVRVRYRDGTFGGGVLLTDNGRVFAAREVSTGDKSRPATVYLADGRELPAIAPAHASRVASRLLRVKASGLPHVSLAASAPADGVQLRVVHFDESDGSASTDNTTANAFGGQVAVNAAPDKEFLVFNAGGELLATESAPIFAKSSDRARAMVQREATTRLLVRPFTPAERGALTRPAD